MALIVSKKMVQTAEYDPIVVEPELTPEKVNELILRGMESAKLDYKRAYDPSSTEDKVKLAKHVLAMANTAGGFIVVGVQNDGTPIGLNDQVADLIDEATMRSQISAYTSFPLSLFVNNHVRHKSLRFAVICVLPVRERFVVADSIGNYENRHGQDRTLFRPGDLLVRHGSASERWNQSDADYLLERRSSAQKEMWLKEFANDFMQLSQLVRKGTIPEINERIFDLPPDQFQKLIVQLLRR